MNRKSQRLDELVHRLFAGIERPRGGDAGFGNRPQRDQGLQAIGIGYDDSIAANRASERLQNSFGEVRRNFPKVDRYGEQPATGCGVQQGLDPRQWPGKVRAQIGYGAGARLCDAWIGTIVADQNLGILFAHRRQGSRQQCLALQVDESLVHAAKALAQTASENAQGNLVARGHLLALDVAHQAPAFFDLLVGENVLLAFVRVLVFLEDELHRRADQLETLAEKVFQVTSIAVG